MRCLPAAMSRSSCMIFPRRALFTLTALAMLLVSTGVCRADMGDVRIIRDVAYRNLHPGEDSSLNKNKLDLYLPSKRRDFPVIFFVHGGAWFHGDKNYLGLYTTLG